MVIRRRQRCRIERY